MAVDGALQHLATSQAAVAAHPQWGVMPGTDMRMQMTMTTTKMSVLRATKERIGMPVANGGTFPASIP